jgi:hypothetical protein
MRSWLFYKATPRENGVDVEFRRVQDGKVSDFLPSQLCGTVRLPSGGDVDRAVQTLVRAAHWVGEAARPANSELALTILKGRW